MKQLGLNDFYNKIQLHNKKKIIGKSAVPFLRNKKVHIIEDDALNIPLLVLLHLATMTF